MECFRKLKRVRGNAKVLGAHEFRNVFRSVAVARRVRAGAHAASATDAKRSLDGGAVIAAADNAESIREHGTSANAILSAKAPEPQVHASSVSASCVSACRVSASCASACRVSASCASACRVSASCAPVRRSWALLCAKNNFSRN